MKKIINTYVIFFIGLFFCATSYSDLPIVPGNPDIGKAIEQDIKNLEQGVGNPRTSIVQQMVNRLLANKESVLRMEDGTNDEVQSLLSNVGEYNNEYQADWADTTPNYDNYRQRLRRLGNNQVAPLYQKVLALE